MLAPLLAPLLLLQAPAAPRPIVLSAAEKVLPGEFTYVGGLRELPDGRVLIADRLDERVVVADFTTGTMRPIGRAGAGPEEYHLPGRMIPLPGDSTLLVDEGNGRLLVIGPGLRIARSFALRVPRVPTALVPRAADPAGRFYVQVPGWAAQELGVPADSTAVLRVDPRGGAVERLALVGTAARPRNPVALRPRIPYVPFSAHDAWAVGADGRLFVVRAAGYVVEWRAPGGARGAGRGPAGAPVRVTAADRLDYVRRFNLTSGIGGRGGAGRPPEALSALPAEMQTAEAVRALADASDWAEVKPPFTDALPRVDHLGRLWVERSGALGAAPAWDLFDGEGRPVGRVVLPAGRRLLALGNGTLYAAAADADGLERVERYRPR